MTFELEISHVVKVPDKVKLSRGMQGKYGFEISVSGDSKEEIFKKIKDFDTKLREMFPTEENKKEEVK